MQFHLLAHFCTFMNIKVNYLEEHYFQNPENWEVEHERSGILGTNTISLSHAMRPGLQSAIFGWQNY